MTGILDEKFDSLSQLYYLAAYAGRSDVVSHFNEYYRSFGLKTPTLYRWAIPRLKERPTKSNDNDGLPVGGPFS